MTTLMEDTEDLSIHGVGVSTFKLPPRPNIKHACHSNCQIHLQPGGLKLPVMKLLRKGTKVFLLLIGHVSVTKKFETSRIAF